MHRTVCNETFSWPTPMTGVVFLLDQKPLRLIVKGIFPAAHWRSKRRFEIFIHFKFKGRPPFGLCIKKSFAMKEKIERRPMFHCLFNAFFFSSSNWCIRESILDGEFKEFFHFVDRVRSKHQSRRDVLNKISSGRDCDRSSTS